jgi:hypothetical protein
MTTAVIYTLSSYYVLTFASIMLLSAIYSLCLGILLASPTLQMMKQRLGEGK